MGNLMPIALIAMAACGRMGFSPSSDGSGTYDAVIGDTAETADGPMAARCAGLAATCGPTGTSNCCDSPVVPGGTFLRSYDVAADMGYPDMRFTATVSAYRLDKYEVTVGRFRQFVDAGFGTQTNPPAAGSGSHATLASSGWNASWNASLMANTTALVDALKCNGTYQTWTDTPGSNESRPINCITWYEAMAFCAWDRGAIPTEAEWNFAASGGSAQRAFPWSSPPSSVVNDDSTYASYYVDATKECFGDMANGCALTDLIAVGTKPAGNGTWGQSDLGGNVYEWVLDWYETPYPTMTCNDCATLTPAFSRAVRGASFATNGPALRSAARGSGYMPSMRGYFLGVRCGRTP